MKIDRIIKEGDMVKEISGKQFRDSGLLWFVNQQLHLFGISLLYDVNTGDITPALCKFRGFSEEINDKGYRKVSEYLKSNIEGLIEDLDD